MAHIRLRSVGAEYELLSARDYNLKRQIMEVVHRRTQPPTLIHALNGIDLDVPEGSRLGLIGANGAGKTTLLSIMSGLLPPTRGKVDVQGRVLALLGAASAGLDPEATGRNNIIMLGVQIGESPAAMRARIDDITEFSGLTQRIDHPVHTYSAGMTARLRFSILTSLRPDVLLIDEGISMADAEFAERASERLAHFMTSAGILVMASHGEALIQQQCHTAVWLHRGAIMSSGIVDQVLTDYHGSFDRDEEVEPAESIRVSGPADSEQTDAVADILSPTDERPDGTPDYPRTVARAYWQTLGRAPDPDGLLLHSSLMQQGLSEADLLAALYNCDEARAAREGWSGEVYLGLSHDIPYSAKSTRGARFLVVSFPGAGTHRFHPKFADELVGELPPVHQLAIGMANDRARGHVIRTWAWDAGALIRQTADRLGVRSSDIICLGHSFQGSLALLAGLNSRAGHLVVGAPPIRIGAAGDRGMERTRDVPGANVLFEPSGADNRQVLGPRSAPMLDTMIDSAASEANHVATITIMVSAKDVFATDCQAFAATANRGKWLRCSVVDASYPKHDAMGPQYYEFARSYLTAVVERDEPALAIEPAPSQAVPPLEPMVGFDQDPEATQPDYGRMASRAYWQILGRAPDAVGLAAAVGRLKSGVALGQLVAELHSSGEARAQRAAWTGEWHLGLMHDIPYALSRRSGARHLVVTMPGAGTHRYIPTASDPVLDGIAVHHLELGLSSNRTFKPGPMATWARDAADLVAKLAADLDIAESDVIFIGNSMKGGGALHVGLLTKAEHIIVGAPTLAGGTVTERIYLGTKSRRAPDALVEFIYTATGMGEEPRNRELIDNLIPDSLASAHHRAHIEIFSSSSDPFWAAALEFRDGLTDHRTVQCTVIEAEYRSHNTMGPLYDTFIRAWLLSIVNPPTELAAAPAGSANSPAPYADPNHAAEVAVAYWEKLGRAADPQGLQFHLIELEHGGSLETLRERLGDSPEARFRLAAWPGTMFHGPSHEIPYSTEAREGSHGLVVTVPGIGIGRFIANAGDPILADLALNRLAIGMSADRPQTPEALRDWVRDAADLVRQEAAELQVDLDDVVCVGQSFRGALAVLVGLEAKIGRIVVGAPPINLGTLLAKRPTGQPLEVQVLYDHIRAASGIDDDPTAAERLDDLFAGAVRQADHAASIEIFVSRSDALWQTGDEFAAGIADHPSLRCSLIDATYADHNSMEPAYREYLHEALQVLPPTTTRSADG